MMTENETPAPNDLQQLHPTEDPGNIEESLQSKELSQRSGPVAYTSMPAQDEGQTMITITGDKIQTLEDNYKLSPIDLGMMVQSLEITQDKIEEKHLKGNSTPLQEMEINWMQKPSTDSSNVMANDKSMSLEENKSLSRGNMAENLNEAQKLLNLEINSESEVKYIKNTSDSEENMPKNKNSLKNIPASLQITPTDMEQEPSTGKQELLSTMSPSDKERNKPYNNERPNHSNKILRLAQIYATSEDKLQKHDELLAPLENTSEPSQSIWDPITKKNKTHENKYSKMDITPSENKLRSCEPLALLENMLEPSQNILKPLQEKGKTTEMRPLNITATSEEKLQGPDSFIDLENISKDSPDIMEPAEKNPHKMKIRSSKIHATSSEYRQQIPEPLIHTENKTLERTHKVLIPQLQSTHDTEIITSTSEPETSPNASEVKETTQHTQTQVLGSKQCISNTLQSENLIKVSYNELQNIENSGATQKQNHVQKIEQIQSTWRSEMTSKHQTLKLIKIIIKRPSPSAHNSPKCIGRQREKMGKVLQPKYKLGFDTRKVAKQKAEVPCKTKQHKPPPPEQYLQLNVEKVPEEVKIIQPKQKPPQPVKEKLKERVKIESETGQYSPQYTEISAHLKTKPVPSKYKHSQSMKNVPGDTMKGDKHTESRYSFIDYKPSEYEQSLPQCIKKKPDVKVKLEPSKYYKHPHSVKMLPEHEMKKKHKRKQCPTLRYKASHTNHNSTPQCIEEEDLNTKPKEPKPKQPSEELDYIRKVKRQQTETAAHHKQDSQQEILTKQKKTKVPHNKNISGHPKKSYEENPQQYREKVIEAEQKQHRAKQKSRHYKERLAGNTDEIAKQILLKAVYATKKSSHSTETLVHRSKLSHSAPERYMTESCHFYQDSRLKRHRSKKRKRQMSASPQESKNKTSAQEPQPKSETVRPGGKAHKIGNRSSETQKNSDSWDPKLPLEEQIKNINKSSDKEKEAYKKKWSLKGNNITSPQKRLCLCLHDQTKSASNSGPSKSLLTKANYVIDLPNSISGSENDKKQKHKKKHKFTEVEIHSIDKINKLTEENYKTPRYKKERLQDLINIHATTDRTVKHHKNTDALGTLQQQIKPSSKLCECREAQIPKKHNKHKNVTQNTEKREPMNYYNETEETVNRAHDRSTEKNIITELTKKQIKSRKTKQLQEPNQETMEKVTEDTDKNENGLISGLIKNKIKEGSQRHCIEEAENRYYKVEIKTEAAKLTPREDQIKKRSNKKYRKAKHHLGMFQLEHYYNKETKNITHPVKRHKPKDKRVTKPNQNTSKPMHKLSSVNKIIKDKIYNLESKECTMKGKYYPKQSTNSSDRKKEITPFTYEFVSPPVKLNKHRRMIITREKCPCKIIKEEYLNKEAKKTKMTLNKIKNSDWLRLEDSGHYQTKQNTKTLKKTNKSEEENLMRLDLKTIQMHATRSTDKNIPVLETDTTLRKSAEITDSTIKLGNNIKESPKEEVINFCTKATTSKEETLKHSVITHKKTNKSLPNKQHNERHGKMILDAIKRMPKEDTEQQHVSVQSPNTTPRKRKRSPSLIEHVYRDKKINADYVMKTVKDKTGHAPQTAPKKIKKHTKEPANKHQQKMNANTTKYILKDKKVQQESEADSFINMPRKMKKYQSITEEIYGKKKMEPDSTTLPLATIKKIKEKKLHDIITHASKEKKIQLAGEENPIAVTIDKKTKEYDTKNNIIKSKLEINHNTTPNIAEEEIQQTPKIRTITTSKKKKQNTTEEIDIKEEIDNERMTSMAQEKSEQGQSTKDITIIITHKKNKHETNENKNKEKINYDITAHTTLNNNEQPLSTDNTTNNIRCKKSNKHHIAEYITKEENDTMNTIPDAIGDKIVIHGIATSPLNTPKNSMRSPDTEGTGEGERTITMMREPEERTIQHLTNTVHNSLISKATKEKGDQSITEYIKDKKLDMNISAEASNKGTGEQSNTAQVPITNMNETKKRSPVIQRILEEEKLILITRMPQKVKEHALSTVKSPDIIKPNRKEMEINTVAEVNTQHEKKELLQSVKISVDRSNTPNIVKPDEKEFTTNADTNNARLYHKKVDTSEALVEDTHLDQTQDNEKKSYKSTVSAMKCDIEDMSGKTKDAQEVNECTLSTPPLTSENMEESRRERHKHTKAILKSKILKEDHKETRLQRKSTQIIPLEKETLIEVSQGPPKQSKIKDYEKVHRYTPTKKNIDSNMLLNDTFEPQGNLRAEPPAIPKENNVERLESTQGKMETTDQEDEKLLTHEKNYNCNKANVMKSPFTSIPIINKEQQTPQHQKESYEEVVVQTHAHKTQKESEVPDCTQTKQLVSLGKGWVCNTLSSPNNREYTTHTAEARESSDGKIPHIPQHTCPQQDSEDYVLERSWFRMYQYFGKRKRLQAMYNKYESLQNQLIKRADKLEKTVNMPVDSENLISKAKKLLKLRETQENALRTMLHQEEELNQQYEDLQKQLQGVNKQRKKLRSKKELLQREMHLARQERLKHDARKCYQKFTPTPKQVYKGEYLNRYEHDLHLKVTKADEALDANLTEVNTLQTRCDEAAMKKTCCSKNVKIIYKKVAEIKRKLQTLQCLHNDIHTVRENTHKIKRLRDQADNLKLRACRFKVLISMLQRVPVEKRYHIPTLIKSLTEEEKKLISWTVTNQKQHHEKKMERSDTSGRHRLVASEVWRVSASIPSQKPRKTSTELWSVEPLDAVPRYVVIRIGKKNPWIVTDNTITVSE